MTQDHTNTHKAFHEWFESLEGPRPDFHEGIVPEKLFVEWMSRYTLAKGAWEAGRKFEVKK